MKKSIIITAILALAYSSIGAGLNPKPFATGVMNNSSDAATFRSQIGAAGSPLTGDLNANGNSLTNLNSLNATGTVEMATANVSTLNATNVIGNGEGLTNLKHASFTNDGVSSSNLWQRAQITQKWKRNAERVPLRGYRMWYMSGTNGAAYTNIMTFATNTANGMKRVGFTMICMDKCTSPTRDASGDLQLFPGFDDPTNITRWTHELGMYNGYYTEPSSNWWPGILSMGSLHNLQRDAKWIANVGFDRVQFDPQGTADQISQVREMAYWLDVYSTNKPIAMRVILAGDYWMPGGSTAVRNGPELKEVATSFGSSQDVGGGKYVQWTTCTTNIYQAWKYRHLIESGYFPDCEIIPWTFSFDDDASGAINSADTNNMAALRGYFGMSAMMCMEQWVGFASFADMGGLSTNVPAIITNAWVQTVQQDPLCIPAEIVSTNGAGSNYVQRFVSGVWSRPLSPPLLRAVSFWNAGTNGSVSTTVGFTNLNLPLGTYSVVDVWNNTTNTVTDGWTATINPMDCGLYVVMPVVPTVYTPSVVVTNSETFFGNEITFNDPAKAGVYMAQAPAPSYWVGSLTNHGASGQYWEVKVHNWATNVTLKVIVQATEAFTWTNRTAIRFYLPGVGIQQPATTAFTDTVNNFTNGVNIFSSTLTTPKTNAVVKISWTGTTACTNTSKQYIHAFVVTEIGVPEPFNPQ